VTVRRQVTLNAIAASPCLVTEPKPHAAIAELASQPIQGRRRIRNTTVLSNFAAEAALGYRHNGCVLVNVKSDIRDTILHDPSPMHEARHRPIRRNPRHLHTVRRVAPRSGGHVV
jgi:hypothetical protein